MHNRRRFLLAVASLALLPGGSLASERSLHHGNSTLEVELSADFSKRSRDELLLWLEHLSQALLQVYGRWPRSRWRIAVRPVSAYGRDPIPWAQVHRGEIDTVEFHVATTATASQLLRNWTGYHELSHLLLPYRGWGDLWFSEGLATYYQNLLQARTGVLTPDQMWQKILEGLQRGDANSSQDGTALRRVSGNLRRNGAYMRVYWSGTWYFLQADLQLRRQTGGELSLDRALATLNDCCGERSMSVTAIVRRLDEQLPSRVFETLYQQVAFSTSMPDFGPTLEALGITVAGGRVQLSQRDRQSALREAITTPL